ncbi:Outer membrane protein beta-barrel domain-containing protein [Chitinophaga jiangningensis]|uniref:Outer membrane protein beta-barrel domain-containing protein n=1 Tax=Chitinophaga jiangningensis TaxID=1419482 RepID=A0A1M7CVX5_9BACT|nr:porin family protein [Chitinophaga jiangningensis]SHL71253.1 Outer membrane protein beta-barrel domain-containing protein [Chitinophaga jiangningensis]
MKKLILSGIIALGSFLTAQAQNVNFGVKGGLNLAKMTQYDNNKVRASFNAGVYANFAITKEWAFQPELLYSGQGTKLESGTILGIPLKDVTIATDYLNIPLMVQYSIAPSFFVEAGPQVGFLLAAKTKVGDNTNKDYKDIMTTADFGLGLGFGYKLDNGLGFSGRYNFGLTNIYNDDVNIDSKNSVAQIGLFYSF